MECKNVEKGCDVLDLNHYNFDWMYASRDDMLSADLSTELRVIWDSLDLIYFAGYVVIDGEAYDALCEVDRDLEDVWVFKEFRAYFGVSGDVENVFDHYGESILRGLRERGVSDATYNRLVDVLNNEDGKVSEDTYYEAFGDALGKLSRVELKQVADEDRFYDEMGTLALKVLKETRARQ